MRNKKYIFLLLVHIKNPNDSSLFNVLTVLFKYSNSPILSILCAC